MSVSQFRHRKSGIGTCVRLNIAPCITRNCSAFDPPIDAAASTGVCRAGPPVEAALFFYFWSLTEGCTISGGAMRSTKIAARIIGVSVAPLLHQRLKFSIVPVGQHNTCGDKQVARRSRRFWQPLALQPKGPAARGVLRYRQFDRATQGRHANFATEHRFIKRDRQIDAQVVTVDLEERMRRDADRDQEIAGAVAGRGVALPLQSDLLAGSDTSGNLDIEFFAGRQPNALLRALDRLFQRHRHGDAEIEIERYTAGIELKGTTGAGSRAARRAAEHAVEDVLESATAAPRAGATGAECVGFETAG